MNIRAQISSAALTLAIMPVLAHAQTVLFADNYDAGTSAGRYDFYSIDNETAPPTYGAGTFSGDVYADFNFNYGGYTYRFTDPDGVTPRTALIPSAPRSTGGTTVGLRFDVNENNGPLTPELAVINAYPKLTQFLGGVAPSGDHKLTFDIWMNYNGGFAGGAGSTEWFITGINQDGNGIGAARVGGEPAGVSKGFGMAVNGERGNNLDYRFYQDNTRFGTIGVPEAGYVATVDANNFGIADGRNQFYQDRFPFPDYETPGGLGKKWNTVEIEYTDGIVYYRINGNLISARSDETVTSGNILLGYGDFANSVAADDDITGVEANFGVYDNVEVVKVTQTRPRYTGATGGAWSNGSNWVNGVPDGNQATADFIGAAGPTTVLVDGGKTVRSIVFDNIAPYTVSGDTITFDSLTTGINGSVVVRNGSHTIAAPISTARPFVANVVGGLFRHTGDLTTTNNITKTGAGVAEFKNLRTVGAVRANGGTLRVAANGTDAATSSIATLTIAGATDAWTAKLDITNNKMVIDYSTTLTVLSTTQNQLKNGFAGGAWTGNGIISSTAQGAATHAIGYAEASDLLGVGGGVFGGLTVDDTAVLIRYTRQGDATMDGVTDLSDFAIVAANFNTPQAWRKGDFNYDGQTDIGDFALLAANFNQTAGDLPSSTVPEPAAISFAAAMLLGVRRRR